jgi:TPR repeat/Tetratricopeptide repeat
MADTLGGQVSAASLIASGLACLERKDIDRAIVEFTGAIKLDPENATAYRRRGNAYARKSYFKKAIGDFNKAVELAPADATAFYFRGRARHLVNELPEAIADYEKAIKLNPANLKAFQYREAILATQKTEAAKSDAETDLTRTGRDAKRKVNDSASNSRPAPFERSDLSEKWKTRFALIEKEAGGTKLTRSENSFLRSFWGFFFSLFYYFFLGMRRKGFVLLGALVLLFAVAQIAGQSFPKSIHHLELLASLAVATWVLRFVSRDYYAYIVRGETMWPRLRFLDRPYAAPAFAAILFVACVILDAPGSRQATADNNLPVAQNAPAASNPQSEDRRDDNRPHRSTIADAAQAIVTAAKPQTWQTQAVKDQLTDEPRLRARAESASESTKYEFDFTCDAKGEHLTISTFEQDNSGKAIPFGASGLLRFKIRADAGLILNMNFRRGDYSNSGSVEIEITENAQNAFSVMSSNKLVFAEIFRGEQIALPVDFSRSFREQCERITQPMRDAVHSARLKRQAEHVPDLLRMIASTAEAVYVIYGFNGPFTGLSSDELQRFDWYNIFKTGRSPAYPAYRDRIEREMRSYGVDLEGVPSGWWELEIEKDIGYSLGGYRVDGFDGKIAVRAVPANGVADLGFAVSFSNIPSNVCARALVQRSADVLDAGLHAGSPTRFQQLYRRTAKRTIVDGKGSIDSIQPKYDITQQDAAAMCGTNAMTTVEWIFAH